MLQCGSCPRRTPWAVGRILPTGDLGCPSSPMWHQDATSLHGAEGTMQPHCHASPGSQGSRVALCIHSVTRRGQAQCQSHVDPLPAQGTRALIWQDLCQVLLPFPLPISLGWRWEGD